MVSVCTDILLHQSGHIMLSDFDLAKQARMGESGGDESLMLPGVVESESDGVSRFAGSVELNKWVLTRGQLFY